MAMYEGRERERGNGSMYEETQSALQEQRHQVEQLAMLLSQQSMQQWQKAIEGVIALPAAIVVGFAATTLYAVSFVTRGFEVFQRQAEEQSQMMRRMSDQRGRELQQQSQRRQSGGDEQSPESRMQENMPRA
jgi:hypothetical protein